MECLLVEQCDRNKSKFNICHILCILHGYGTFYAALFCSFVWLRTFFSVSPWCFLQNDVHEINLICRTHNSAKMINKEASKQPKICSASDEVMLMMCDDKRTYEIFCDTWIRDAELIWEASATLQSNIKNALASNRFGLVWWVFSYCCHS